MRLAVGLLSQDKEPRGIIPLENLSIREVEDPRKPVSCSLAPCVLSTSWPPAVAAQAGTVDAQ